MSILTLIFGLIIGFVAGMIVAAGSWRNALAKLGDYATNAAKAPPAAPAPIVRTVAPATEVRTVAPAPIVRPAATLPEEYP